VSSTTLQVERIKQEMREKERQRRAYQKMYETQHAAGTPITMPSRSAKQLTVVSCCDHRCRVPVACH
jgi:hypothetical protein